MRVWMLALCALGLASAAEGEPCCGDCSGDLTVAVNELVTEVGYALSGCPTDGPCCGDCDGSGSVAINELVTSVGNALDGCPGVPTPTAMLSPTITMTPSKTVVPSKTPIPSKTDTPTRTATPTKTVPTPTATHAGACPIGFADNNTDGHIACGFEGSGGNSVCKANNIGATFVTDGRSIAFGFTNPTFFIVGTVNGSGADLAEWGQKEDLSDLAPISGNAVLGDGSSLRIDIAVPQFVINQCPVVLYSGLFLDTFTFHPAVAAAGLGQLDAGELIRRAREAMGR